MGDSGMELYPDSESHYSGKLDWVMNQGLTVGKKILVTGLVVTSAPVVVPSILVLSALGFACSLPSTVFLATYLVTESIMTKLLPLQTQHEEIEDSDDQKKYQKKASGEGIRRGTLDSIEDQDNEIVEEDQNGYKEGGGGGGGGGGVGVGGGEYMMGQRDEDTVDMVVEETHAVGGIVVIEEGGDEGTSGEVSIPVAAAVVPVEVRTVVVEVSEVHDDVDDENEELAEGTTGLLESIRNEGLSESPAEVDEKTTQAAAAGTEKLPQDSIAAASTVAAVPQPAAGGNANQNGSSSEVLSNDKIWEQIDALRLIVGYTASRQPSLMEELRALCVFTGVEMPAASYSDPCDLVEVNWRLRNLKLIVGVK